MNLDKVPQELRDLPQWVLWKEIVRDGQPTKVPFQASGVCASSTDPATWATFDVVSECHDKGGYSGIGFVFSETDEFCGIDLDGCRNPETGEVAEWARGMLKILDSYSEVSPSKTGVKVFLCGKSPMASGRKAAVEQDKVSDKEPAVEVYDSKRYFSVTGERLSGLSKAIESRQVEINAVCEQFFPVEKPKPQERRVGTTVAERARRYLEKVEPAIAGQGGHNTTFRAACILVLGFALSEGEALGLLSEWNVSCEPPWSERELRHKVESANKQSGARAYLRDVDPVDWASIEIPHYNQPPQAEETPIRIITLDEAANKYLSNLRSGAGELIELGLPDLDYAIGGGVEYGEMLIFAARPGHGKSAIALQAVHHVTWHGLNAMFVTEEMSNLALGKRVVQFASDIPQEKWSAYDGQVQNDLTEHFRLRSQCLVVENCRTADRVASEVRKARDEHDVRFVVIDYAQLLQSKGNGRYEQTTNTSIALRQVASECEVILMVLCQLNRSIESRQSYTPIMSDLKDTGQLEQDADVIVFQVWPHRIDSSNDPHQYQFFVAKNRNRPVNQPAVVCKFMPSRQMLIDSNRNLPMSRVEVPNYFDDEDF